MKKLTHLDKDGQIKMVDISGKAVTQREAVARGSVYVKRQTLRLITDKKISKGDVFETARLAGIMAAKRTSELIPLCHPLLISSIDINFEIDRKKGKIDIVARAKNTGQTGVEMEALIAVTVSALTIYDMCKSVERGITISDIMLLEKRGGKSGEWIREERE
jgi:cyclic pyranopterin phosphate synthase